MRLVIFLLLFIFPGGLLHEPPELCEPIAARCNTEALPFTTAELDILYRIAWAEARGEDDKGIILVINVILNRMAHPQFPNTVHDVVFQRNQFTPVTDGAFDRAIPCDRIVDLVHQALLDDLSKGALFFNTTSLRETSWAARNRTYLFTHGGHSFYL